jgi:transposase
MAKAEVEKLRRRSFTLEFKLEAVKMKRDQALSYAEVGRRLEIAPRLIKHWERAYEAGKLTPQSAKRTVSPEQQELSRLRAELSRVKMENAILKKAAAYFAKESL